MTEIDERIVAMQFDNKNFEKHAKETIKTLEKLRENLDMEDAVDSLNGLTKASKDLNLDRAAESAEKLHRAFTGVQKIASKTFSVATFPISKLGRALGGLASDVKKWFGIDLARTLEQSATKAVKALTVEPVSAGWNEYEMKMDSVKTILAGTKKEFAELSDEEHLGKVKSVLEDLNHYADETIYSFKDMTSNIGKFTNAGVKLDVAAKSMMGISNLAAQAGQGAQQASMAMYNFSQAMGLGYVELRDWRSIENANMATLEFKDSLIEVGLAMGTLKKDSRGVVKTAVKGEKQVEVTSEKLRDTLSKKWLTSDVLSKALEIYSGELSREEIKRLGNFTEEQIDHFMELGAEAKKSATEVRTFTKMFDALKEAAQSGWAMSFEYIIGDINEATKLWTSINERISGWLNASAENRNKILQEWRGQKTDETGRVWTISDHDGRQDLIDSLNSVLNIMENIGGAISKVAEDVFGKLDGRKLADFTQRIAGMLHEIDMWLGDIGDSTSRISKMSRILKLVLAPLKLLFRVTKEIGGAIVKFILPFVDPILNFFATLGDLVLNLVDGKVSLGTFFDGIAQAAKAGWSQIKNVLFGNAGFNFNTGKAVRDGPIAKFFAGIGETITNWVGKLQDGTAFEELGQWFTDKWNAIKDLILGPLVKDETTGKMVHSGPVGQLFDSLSDTIGAEIEKFKNNPIIKSITTTLGSIFDPIKEFFVGKDFGTKNGVKVRKLSGFEVMIQSIKKSLGLDKGITSFGELLNNLSSTINTEIENFKKNPIVQNVVDTLSGIFDPIKEFFVGKDIDTSMGITVHKFGGFELMIEQIKSTFGLDGGNNDISDSFTEWSEKVVAAWSAVTSWFTQANADVQTFIADVNAWEGWEKISEFFGGIWTTVSGWFTTTFSQGTWNDIVGWYNDVNTKVTTFINNVQNWGGWEKISDFFRGVWTDISGWFAHTFSQGTWDDIVAWYGEVNTNVTEFIANVRAWPAWDKIGTFFGGVWTIVSGWFTSTFNRGTWEAIVSWYGSVDTEARNFIGRVQEWEGWGKISEFFGGIWTIVSGWFTKTFSRGTWDDIVAWYGNIDESAREFIGKVQSWPAWDKIGNFFGGIWETVSGWFTNTFNQGTWDSIKSWFNEAWATISNFLSGGSDKKDPTEESAFTKFVHNVWDEIVRIANQFGQTPIIQTIGTFLSDLWKVISDFITKEDPVTGETPFGHMVSSIYEDINSFVNDATKMATLDNLVQRMNGLWESISNILFPKKNEISEKASGAKAPDVGVSGFAEVAQTLTAEWDANKGSIEEVSSSVTSTLESATGTFNSASGFLDTLKQLIDDIKKKIEELNIGEKFDKTLGDISKGLSDFAANLPDISAEGIGATVNGFFTNLSESLGGLIDTLKQKVGDWTGLDSVTELINSLTGFVGDIGKNFDEFKAEAKQAWENSALKKIIDFVTGIFKAIGDFGVALMESMAQFLSLGIGPTLLATAIATIATIIHDIHGFFKEGRKILKITKKNAILEQIPTGILMFAGALYLVSEALGKLGTMTEDQWNRGIERLALVGLVFTLLFGAFKFLDSVFEKNRTIEEQINAKMTAREKILSTLGSRLITFAAAFFIIKDALPALISSLNGVNVDGGTIIASIAGVLLLIGGISALIPTLTALGATIKVGWKEALIGIAGSFVAIGLVFEGISLLGVLAREEHWVENFQELGAAFGALIGGFTGQKDISYMGQILKGAGDLTDEAGNVDTSALKIVGDIADMLSMVQSKLPKENTVFEKWFGGGTMSFEHFAEVMPKLAEGLLAYGQGLQNNAWNSDSIVDYDAVDKASSALMKIANALNYLNGVESNRIQYNAEKVFEFLDVLAGNEKFKKDIQDFSGLADIVNTGIESAAEQIDAHWIADAIASGILNDRDKINKAVQDVINGANAGVVIGSTGDANANSQTESTIGRLASMFSGGNAAQTPGTGFNLDGLIDNVIGGLDFEKHTSEIETQLGGLVGQMTGTLNGFNLEEHGYSMDEFSTLFLDDAMPDEADVESAAKEMVRQLSDSVKNGYSSMRYSGARLDQGLANGITDWSGVPIGAMRNLCQRIIDTAESKFAVGSPSRVFEQIGMYNMLGLQNGTDNYGDYAVNSVANIGTDYITAMNEALQPLAQIVTQDFDVNPVITPVLNMDDIRNGAAAIGGMFGNRYSLGMTMPSMIQNSRVPEIRVNPQNNTAQAIASINERIDQLNESITNMKIVLDTGVLVGSTVSAYDRALGARASRARRG